MVIVSDTSMTHHAIRILGQLLFLQLPQLIANSLQLGLKTTYLGWEVKEVNFIKLALDSVQPSVMKISRAEG